MALTTYQAALSLIKLAIDASAKRGRGNKDGEMNAPRARLTRQAFIVAIDHPLPTREYLDGLRTELRRLGYLLVEDDDVVALVYAETVHRWSRVTVQETEMLRANLITGRLSTTDLEQQVGRYVNRAPSV